MPIFKKKDKKELKELLYNSYIHDAKFESIKYECESSSLKIRAINPIFNVKIDLIFRNIIIAFTTRGNEFGSNETILSLTAEDDFSYLQNYIQKYNESSEDFLYLLFQMFSGDELHIVSEEVIVEIQPEKKEMVCKTYDAENRLTSNVDGTAGISP